MNIEFTNIPQKDEKADALKYNGEKGYMPVKQKKHATQTLPLRCLKSIPHPKRQTVYAVHRLRRIQGQDNSLHCKALCRLGSRDSDVYRSRAATARYVGGHGRGE